MNRTSAIAVLTLLALTLAGVLLLGGGAGSRPAAGLVPVGDRPAEAPLADERAELVLAPEGDLVSAPPEGAREPVRSEAAERPKGRVRAPPRARPRPPETREAPPRSDEAVFRLRVIVTFESFELSAPNESVVVTAFLGDSDGVSTSRAPLGASAEFEWRRRRNDPKPHGCEIVVSHPDFVLYRGQLDLSRVRPEGQDAEGRLVHSARHSVRLQRPVARLVGALQDASEALLVAYSEARLPERLEVVDTTNAEDGRYELRVPRTGDWLVVALRDDRHPTYAVVTVPKLEASPTLTDIPVPLTFAPLATQARIDAIRPAGFDPSGLKVSLAPKDTRAEVLGREQRHDDETLSSLPDLTWHRTSAAPPRGSAFGVDLRGAEPRYEQADSIARRHAYGALDASGAAFVRGGATGSAQVSVQDPFAKDVWELGEQRDLDLVDSADVTLPVGRVDVRVFGAEGPAVGATVLTDVLADVAGGGRGGRGGREGVPAAPGAVTTDAAGRAVLYVPSLRRLRLVARDAAGQTATTDLTAPAGAGLSSCVLNIVATPATTAGAAPGS